MNKTIFLLVILIGLILTVVYTPQKVCCCGYIAGNYGIRTMIGNWSYPDPAAFLECPIYQNGMEPEQGCRISEPGVPKTILECITFVGYIYYLPIDVLLGAILMAAFLSVLAGQVKRNSSINMDEK